MRDVVFVAITVAFFLMTVGYVALCDRIVGGGDDEVIAGREADHNEEVNA